MSIGDRRNAFLPAVRHSCADPSGADGWRQRPPSIAVANAGGLGACGALLMTPEEIGAWTEEVRAASNGGCLWRMTLPALSPECGPLRLCCQLRDGSSCAKLSQLLAMQCEIAWSRHLRALSNQCVELDKRVKRHGWKAVCSAW
jgi:hypothetical protein